MHEIQEKLLELIGDAKLQGMTLREIGAKIGDNSAQKIKHHLSQLERKGFILIDKEKNEIKKYQPSSDSDFQFVSIPIYGYANCGPALQYADNNRPEGFLKVSSKMILHKNNIFALKAVGDSLNKAKIGKSLKNIEDGDYVLIDKEKKDPKNGEYIVSIIDGMANLKKIIFDKDNEQIILMSESTKSYQPIFIHESDNYHVGGIIFDVLKYPKI